MMREFFIYLVQVSIGLVAFALAYRLFFTRSTHFQYRRAYLLGVLLLSYILPFIPLNYLLTNTSWTPYGIEQLVNENVMPLNIQPVPAYAMGADNHPDTSPGLLFIPYFLLFLYLGGCIFRAWWLQQNIKTVFRLIRINQKEKMGANFLVWTNDNLPAFSFLNYIFIPAHYKLLDKTELELVIRHEKIHASQKHTLDLLLYEVAGIFFWFNPAVYYLRSSIRQVHEFLVDSTITQSKGMVRKYGELLIKLATQTAAAPIPILNTFSNQQFKERITMLTKTKSKPGEKLKFLCFIPVLGLALVLCSFLEQDFPVTSQIQKSSSKKEIKNPASFTQKVIIRKLSWTGNEAYSDEELTQVLGLKEGDEFNKENFDQRLGFNPEGKDITALYMDKGYLFFHVEPKEIYTDNVVDLEIAVSEGPLVAMGRVIIKGNVKVKSEEILQKVTMKSGELFNRAELIKSQKQIQNMGYFKPEAIVINPVPREETDGSWIVDIEFTVEEL